MKHITESQYQWLLMARREGVSVVDIAKELRLSETDAWKYMTWSLVNPDKPPYLIRG